jgi:hypothetical protein
MTHIPIVNGVLEGLGGPIDGLFLVMGLVVLTVLLAGFAVLLWVVYSTRWTERTLRCPVDGRTAQVKMLIGPDGSPVDVGRCSLQRFALGCEKACLRAA